MALFGVVGLVATAQGKAVALSPWLSFDKPQDIFHLAMGLAALALGFAPVPDRLSRRLAIAVGTLYLALGVLGSLHGNLYGYPARAGARTHLEMTENIVHFLVGAWGAYVGTNAPEKD